MSDRGGDEMSDLPYKLKHQSCTVQTEHIFDPAETGQTYQNRNYNQQADNLLKG